MTAQEFVQVLHDHLSGYNTVFHQLAQVIAKIAKHHNAKFQANLAEGISDRTASPSPCLAEASPPQLKVKRKLRFLVHARRALEFLSLNTAGYLFMFYPLDKYKDLKCNGNSILELDIE